MNYGSYHYFDIALIPVEGRTPDGAVKGIIRYDIYLDGHFVGSRRKHALCHAYSCMKFTALNPEPGRTSATIHQTDATALRAAKARNAPLDNRQSAPITATTVSVRMSVGHFDRSSFGCRSMSVSPLATKFAAETRDEVVAMRQFRL